MVELLIVDKDAVTATDDPDLLAAAGSSTVWRLAEARALAARVAELVAAGLATPCEVVVLMRATTDIQVYDRALAAAGLRFRQRKSMAPAASAVSRCAGGR